MIKKLHEITLNITDGKHGDCESDKNSKYYFISAKDIDEYGINYSLARKITKESYIESHKRTKLDINDILVTNSGTIGKMCFIKNIPFKTTFQKSVAIIKPNTEEIIPSFLFYYLLANKNKLINLANGSTQKNLLLKDIRNFEIHIPDCLDQQHIVNTIGTIDDLIEKYEQIKIKIDYLLQKEWNFYINKFSTKIYKLKDLISYSNTGADAIQKAPIVEYQTDYKCVRVGDFTNNREYVDWGYCELTKSIYNQYKLNAGDVLITRTASIGLAKYISEDIKAVYNNGIIRLKANSKILPLLLFLICSTNDFVGYVKGIEAGSSTRPNMKIDYLLNYSINIPSIENQLLIVNKLEKYILEKDKISARLLKLNNLKKQYLKKFFG